MRWVLIAALVVAGCAAETVAAGDCVPKCPERVGNMYPAGVCAGVTGDNDDACGGLDPYAQGGTSPCHCTGGDNAVWICDETFVTNDALVSCAP